MPLAALCLANRVDLCGMRSECEEMATRKDQEMGDQEVERWRDDRRRDETRRKPHQTRSVAYFAFYSSAQPCGKSNVITFAMPFDDGPIPITLLPSV